MFYLLLSILMIFSKSIIFCTTRKPEKSESEVKKLESKSSLTPVICQKKSSDIENTVDKVKSLEKVSKPDENAENVVYLRLADLPKLDKSVEDLHNPAVHDRAIKNAIENTIIDPKHTTFAGNIDVLSENERVEKSAKFLEDLETDMGKIESKEKEKETTETELRVKVREDKCVMFETNEVPTDELEDLKCENNNK